MAWLNSCLAPWRITSVRTSPLVGSGTIRISFVENSMVAYSFGLVGQLGKNSDTFSQSTPPFLFRLSTTFRNTSAFDFIWLNLFRWHQPIVLFVQNGNSPIDQNEFEQ